MLREDSGALRGDLEARPDAGEHGPEACPRAGSLVVPGAGLQPPRRARPPHRVPLGRWVGRPLQPGQPVRRAPPARRPHGPAAGQRRGAEWTAVEAEGAGWALAGAAVAWLMCGARPSRSGAVSCATRGKRCWKTLRIAGGARNGALLEVALARQSVQHGAQALQRAPAVAEAVLLRRLELGQGPPGRLVGEEERVVAESVRAPRSIRDAAVHAALGPVEAPPVRRSQ